MPSFDPLTRSFSHASLLYKAHIYTTTLAFAITRDYIELDLPFQSSTIAILTKALESLFPIYLDIFIALSFSQMGSNVSELETLFTFITTGRWHTYRFHGDDAKVRRPLRDERDRMLFLLSNWFAVPTRVEQGIRGWTRLIVPLWGGLETFSGVAGGWSEKGSLLSWGFVLGCTFGAVLLGVIWLHCACASPVAAVVNQWFILQEVENFENGLVAEGLEGIKRRLERLEEQILKRVEEDLKASGFV